MTRSGIFFTGDFQHDLIGPLGIRINLFGALRIDAFGHNREDGSLLGFIRGLENIIRTRRLEGARGEDFPHHRVDFRQLILRLKAITRRGGDIGVIRR